MRLTKRGQSVTEYAVVFSVVAAAILGMQIFVRRGLQAKEHDVVHYFTKVSGGSDLTGSALGTTAQYEPYYASSTYTVSQDASSTEQFQTGGAVQRDVTKEGTTRTGSSTTGIDTAKDDSWSAQ